MKDKYDHTLENNVSVFNRESLHTELVSVAINLSISWAQSIEINEKMGVVLTSAEKEQLERAVNVLFEAVQQIKGNNEEQPDDDELSRLIKEAGFRRVEPEENAEIARFMERRKLWGLDDDGGNLETLSGCLDYIEQYGKDKAERDMAIAKAREILSHFNSNIDEAEGNIREAEMWLDAIRDDIGKLL